MNSIGSILREARIEKGYTLNTLQQITKIQKKYLVAIEEEKFDALPSNYYLRTFVKQYADVVGINGDDIIEKYLNDVNIEAAQGGLVSIENIESDEIGSRMQNRQKSAEKDRLEILLSYLPLFFLVAIILMIIISLIFAISRMNRSTSNTLNEVTSVTIVSTVSPNNAEITTSQTPTETTILGQLGENQLRMGNVIIEKISGEGEETIYEILADSYDGIKFGANGHSFVWLGILEDDVMVVDTTISEGDEFEYEVSSDSAEEVRMRLGYPDGGTFTINGQTLELNNIYFPDTVVFRLKTDETQSLPSQVEAVSEEVLSSDQ